MVTGLNHFTIWHVTINQAYRLILIYLRVAYWEFTAILCRDFGGNRVSESRSDFYLAGVVCLVNIVRVTGYIVNEPR